MKNTTAPARLIVEKRPAGPDFDWYVRDIADYDTNLPTYEHSKSTGYVKNLKAWVENPIGEFHLNIDRLKKDWSEGLRGEKTLPEISDPQHCLDSLLLESEATPDKTEERAHSLSKTIQVVFPIEHERYLGRDANRMREIDIELRGRDKRGELVPTKLVAERLDVGKRRVRQLAADGELVRPEPNKGLYTPSSVFKFLKKRHRQIFD